MTTENIKKDVIYIDVEDDITAIIGKVKQAPEKIVALVPPKRAGVLQSAVNLRLLARTAKNSGKNLVLITNDQALVALSAMSEIPVAKNLHSKPETAEIPALEIDDGEDVIDGSQLPVGELAATAPPLKVKDSNTVKNAIDTIDIDIDKSQPVSVRAKEKAAKKSGVKVPDFSRFRKKIFIIGAGLVAFITFLIWAIWFAPAATVIVTAGTSPEPISLPLVLGGSQPTNIEKGTIQTLSKQTTETTSVDFEATGQKDVGQRASGSITVRNCDYAGGFTLQAGTRFTSSSGKVFTSSSAVTVPGYTSPSSSLCTLSSDSAGTATVQVQAQASGESYNIGSTSYTISSIPSGSKVDAVGTSMSGGTTQIATIVTAADVQAASEKLVEQSERSNSDIKKELVDQFNNGEIVIEDSFTVSRSPVVSTPAIGAEVTSSAKLTSEATYSITAIAKSELRAYLKNALEKQITDEDKQRIYDDGIDTVSVSGYRDNNGQATVNVSATGRIGPNIEEDNIKEQAKGKRYGEIQSSIQRLDGVNDVDIKFSYFWVRTVPNDVNKIDVEFKLEDD